MARIPIVAPGIPIVAPGLSPAGREATRVMVTSMQRPRIGELLTGAGRLTESQVAEGLREQGLRRNGESPQRLGRCLVRLGYLSEDGLLSSLGEQLGLERVELARTTIPPAALEALPVDYVRRHRILPLELRSASIVVATSDPANSRLIDDVRLLTGLEVEERLASQRQIVEKIAECYEITVERLIEDLHTGDGEAAEITSDTLHEIEVMASEPTVVNLVNLIISSALKERSSDIHFVPFEKGIELRYRIDGVLHEIPPPPRNLHAALISRVKIMAEMDIAERFVPQDGHFQIRHAGRRVDVRVGTMPTIHGESLVMRLLEKDAEVMSLGELGLDADRVGLLDGLLGKPYGIFLATGPTGCGKTTSLYSILSSIYSKEKKILTLEDPVEYELAGVTQIPIKPARGFTFASGLRSILRQDPDVIMVGEIRDFETAETAIRAALTGHLVFSTLHTNDAAGAITRLLDMGVEAFLIASSVEAILAQRLVRKICPGCREEVPLDSALRQKLQTIGMAPELAGNSHYYRGRGCDDCRMTGYRGRTGLFEILVMHRELRDMVLAKRPSTEIKSMAVKSMITVRQDGLRKCADGLTSADEVLRVAMGSSGDDT